MTDKVRKYTSESGSGRMDTNGIEWFACDPYPTWYRWENGNLYEADRDEITLIHSNRKSSSAFAAKAPWADGLNDWMK